MQRTSSDLELAHALHNRLCQMFYAVDERDWDALAGIFTQDCVKSRVGSFSAATDAPIPGRDAIVEQTRFNLSHCGPTQHFMGNFTAEWLSPTEAKTRCYGRAFHRGSGTRADLWLDVSSDYVMTWRNEGDAWRAFRFVQRVFSYTGSFGALGPAFDAPQA